MVGSRVYVGGLPYGTRERDLEKFFKGYGRTRDILIKNGYGFVEFEDYRDADDAVYELNGKELLGERVVVEPARGTARGGSHRDRYDDRYGRRGGRYDSRYNNSSRSNSRYGPPLRTEYRLIVENLSSRVSWQDLKDYMRQAGEVTYADAHKQNRNEGVVEFATLKDMKTAIEKLDDTELNGRRIRLVEDTRRNGRRGRSRSSTTSRSRSRSRHRSRSHSRRSSRRSRESRSKSRGSRSKSPAEKKSRSRSRYSEKSHSRSRDSARSVSKDSNQSNRDRNRSGSNISDKGKSRSRDRSRSEDKNDRSRSGSVNNHSPDRNESMED
ncbi:serine-arginine protein 55 isoform X1 [Chironomus tepperi]|uniref:serine-arginine protein 55 isoform X1 n=1 Tax=Chironomus tepperi TaxID=113505 RepID=UPI00391F97E3